MTKLFTVLTSLWLSSSSTRQASVMISAVTCKAFAVVLHDRFTVIGSLYTDAAKSCESVLPLLVCPATCILKLSKLVAFRIRPVNDVLKVMNRGGVVT